MASLHCSGNKALFSNLKRCKPVDVQVANHEIVAPRYRGTVKMRVLTAAGKPLLIPIHNVYYHEAFAANLLSWNVLREMQWEFHSTSETSYLMTPGGNKIRLSTDGRVSMIKGTVTEPASDSVYALGDLMSAKVKDFMRLHERLGHVPYAYLLRTLNSGRVLDVTKLHFDKQTLDQAKKLISECPACTAGRVTRSWLGERGLDKGVKPLEAIHMDTYFVQLEDGDRKWMEYGVTMTDPYSGWRYHSAVSSKEQIAGEVIAAIQHAQTQFDRTIKRLYTDGGSEFINQTLKEYCRRQGIELHYSPARTPQLNGVAERSVRSCKDATRTLLAHSRVPWRFWTYAANHATFLWNRSMISKRTGVTPYESLYGKKPSAKHWGTFGCNAWIHVPKEQRSSLAPKAEPCVYLGHDSRQNCACVYILRTRKLVRSRDVTYRPDSFTLARSIVKGDLAIEKAIEEMGFFESEQIDESLSQDEKDLNESDSEISSSSDPTIATSSEDKQWDLERIKDQRWYGRKKEHQYRCVWTGDYDDTWEPASQILQDAPQLVEDFVATLPPSHRYNLRQRHDQSSHTVDESGSASSRAQTESKSDSADDESDKSDDHPQVHMVLSAMRMMQAPHASGEFNRGR